MSDAKEKKLRIVLENSAHRGRSERGVWTLCQDLRRAARSSHLDAPWPKGWAMFH